MAATKTPATGSRRSTSSRRAAKTDRAAHKPLQPLTIDHFRAYARLLVLDNWQTWDPESFQLDVVADLLAGARELWAIIPEGNGKTTLMSGVALYHGDYVDAAEVLMAASSRDQCGLLFGQGAGFVTRTPGMSARFRVYEGYRRIACLNTHGRIQVFAADDRTGDGVIPTLLLLDELHRHRDLRLYQTWRGKLDKRGGQLAAISIAGEPDSEFEQARERMRTEASEVKRTGRHVRAAGENAVLHEWALQPGDDPENLRLVKQANPFSGVTVASLKRKRASPTMTTAHWLRFSCNVATRTEQSAVSEAEWAAAGVAGEIPLGEAVDVGLDLGWKWDCTALVPLWHGTLGRCTILRPPRDGASLQPRLVRQAFMDMHDRTPIRRVVMDPNAGGEQLAEWLEEELGCEVITWEQTPVKMAAASEKFMEGLRGGELKHHHDPELTRHVLNAIARLLPNGTFRFDRPTAARRAPGQERREIDALVAAAVVYAASKIAPAVSVYERKDLLVLGEHDGPLDDPDDDDDEEEEW